MASKVGPAAPLPQLTTIFRGFNLSILINFRTFETYLALASGAIYNLLPVLEDMLQASSSANFLMTLKSASSSRGLDADLTIFMPL